MLPSKNRKKPEYKPKYWHGTNRDKAITDQLEALFIPPNGESETLAGEIYRIVNRLYYDRFNNGMINKGFAYYQDLGHVLYGSFPYLKPYLGEVTRTEFRRDVKLFLAGKGTNQFADWLVSVIVKYAHAYAVKAKLIKGN